MNRKLLHLAMATSLVGLAACKESTSAPTALFDNVTVTTDVAQSAGDAAATTVETVLGNEAAAALPSPPAPAFDLFGGPSFTYTRSRTCYDGSGAVVAGCTPMSSVRKIVTHVTVDGNRSGTNSTAGAATVNWSGAVHRVADDTATRNFTNTTETSRTHSAAGTAHDTTTFSNGTVSRTHVEAAHDAVKALTWNLPRSSNPYPVSGSIVRLDSLHTTFVKGTQTETRDLVKSVEVDFPADAQGNVVLKIDGKTCNLNLVTHAVTNCK
jgi:hypothetical protein